MEEQCDDLVIDCLQGMVGEQGCQVTVRRREHILDPDALEQLKEKIASAMACPPNTGRFLDWDDD